ncbi:hypothetical protein Tco_0230754, partial [Tanacetum coccineum]
TLSEEHYVQEDYTADVFFEDIIDRNAAVTPDFERKPKTILKKPTSLAQERNQMMNFLKGQGYKNLQKLKYQQMKELYDKVQESIKDSFKDFIPMDSERENQMLKERDEKRLLRKRKATISEEQPSKKLKESLEGISMIIELQVIDSPDGEYLIIHRANNHFRAFDTDV